MIEDVTGIFTKDIDLRKKLESELTIGFDKYSELAEFNFIAGYAVSIFPWEFGDYEELDTKGTEMLKKAHEMEPTNSIYQMVYLGSQSLNEKGQKLYKIACAESKIIIKSEYSGKGVLNEYFNQVFNRDEKKPAGNNGYN